MKTLLKLLFGLAAIQAAFLGFLMYSPTLLDIEPQEYNLPVKQELHGPLEANELLTNIQKLFSGRLKGPESLAIVNGKLYTGTESGFVIRVENDQKFTKLVQFGRKCYGPWEQEVCGRPMGIRATNSTIYVVDAYYGLHSIDIKTGASKELVPGSAQVAGKKLAFLDHLDINENAGKVYMTQFSTKWDLRHAVYSFVERKNCGRVLSYDLNTGKLDVIMDKLHGPNGLQLTPDRNALLVAETWKWRIIRYEVSGPKKGQMSVFARLPGEVGNIVASPRGGYWVAVTNTRNASNPDLADVLAGYPTIRKILARITHATGSILQFFADILGDFGLKEFAHSVKSGYHLAGLSHDRCMLVELDAKGKALKSLQSSNPQTCFFTEVAEDQGNLYLASFENFYLGRLKM